MTAAPEAPAPITKRKRRESLRNDALIEDAEFLARHGVHHFDAATRLGQSSWGVLRRRLTKLGRIDILDAFRDNTRKDFSDEDLETFDLFTSDKEDV